MTAISCLLWKGTHSLVYSRPFHLKVCICICTQNRFSMILIAYLTDVLSLPIPALLESWLPSSGVLLARHLLRTKTALWVVRLWVTFIGSLAVVTAPITHNQQNPVLLAVKAESSSPLPVASSPLNLLRVYITQNFMGLWESVGTPGNVIAASEPWGIFFARIKTQVLYIFFHPAANHLVNVNPFPQTEEKHVEKIRVYPFILATFQFCVRS